MLGETAEKACGRGLGCGGGRAGDLWAPLTRAQFPVTMTREGENGPGLRTDWDHSLNSRVVLPGVK